MNDAVTPLDPKVASRMSRQRRRDTAPELALRHELHARGLRFRLHVPVPGRSRRTIDIAFTRAHLAVFVDGCFWHGCPVHGTKPTNNRGWWAAKIARNQARDDDTDAALVAAGWCVVRVWEHEGAGEAADRIERVLARLERAGGASD